MNLYTVVPNGWRQNHSMADAIERELHEVGVSLFRDSLFVGPPGLPLCAQGPIASTLAMA